MLFQKVRKNYSSELKNDIISMVLDDCERDDGCKKRANDFFKFRNKGN